MGQEPGGGDGGPISTTPSKHNVPCPFSVEPYSGDIEAGGEQLFTVRFAPQEVCGCSGVAYETGLWHPALLEIPLLSYEKLVLESGVKSRSRI